MIGAGYGKVPDPPGAAPRRIEMKSEIPLPGVKRVKIRSGPYKVPNMGVKSMGGHAGMLEGYFDKDVQKPCEECNILTQVGGLEYANGTDANIDTGMWLHHMVMHNIGPRRWDATGINSVICAPFLVSGTSAYKAERFFVSGNERTPFHYYEVGGQQPSAYHLDKADKFKFILELMNMNMDDRVVYITQTFDYIDGPLPPGWQDVKTVFLDVKQCLDSEVKPPEGQSKFTLTSKPWIPNIEGRILDAGGHVHDGGLTVNIASGTGANTTLCDAVAKYSEKPTYVFKGTSMGKDKVAKDHISSMVGCEAKQIKGWETKRDQQWVIKAEYDFSSRTPDIDGGEPAEVMGIAMMLVAVPPGKSLE